MAANTRHRSEPPTSSGAASTHAGREHLAVAGATTGFWRPNDRLSSGQLIGLTVDGDRPVRAGGDGHVTAIQYDVDRDEVILEVALDLARSS